MTKSFPVSAIMRMIERAKGKCENPKCGRHIDGEPHHIFRKSQYFGKDRNKAWNGANLCHECHASIHQEGGKDGVWLDWYLKTLALGRYRGEARAKLASITNRIKFKVENYERLYCLTPTAKKSKISI